MVNVVYYIQLKKNTTLHTLSYDKTELKIVICDALYGKFKATSPVIVFDMEQVIPKDIQNTSSTSVNVSRLITAGGKNTGSVTKLNQKG